MKKHAPLAALACLVAAAAAHAAPPPEDPTHENLRFIPYEVIVKFKDGAPKASAAILRAELPGVSLSEQPGHFTLARADIPMARLYDKDSAKAATLSLLTRLRQREDVAYAQLNYLFDLSLTPNDPLYPQQWHYPLVNLPAAWDITRGSSAVRIAILDTGRTTHPDLAGRWSTLEYNAAAPGTSAMDVGNWRHGTHVAGIAGAASNNGSGGAGVCHNCTLLNVKVASANGSLSMSSVVNGVNWAVDNGASVLNMSFESSNSCTQALFPALREAIDRAVGNGVNVIAAAGNNAVNVTNVTPASCPGVVSVAATDRYNILATYSSRGVTIGVSAPGGGGVHTEPYSGYGIGVGCPDDPGSYFYPYTEGVLSSWTTTPASGSVHCHRYLSGTSMAAPHVAGAVGLMLSVKPNLRPEQIQQLLKSTATALPSCGTDCGPGLLNAYAAVDLARNTSTGPCSSNVTSKRCTIAAIAQYRSPGGVLTESVFANGFLWQFNASGSQIGPTRNLRAIPRFANGPCAYAPAGQPCAIDSVTTLEYPGAGYVESVTAYGRGWNFDAAGNPYPGNGVLLSSVARFASGPCAYAVPASSCTFDARTLVNSPVWGGLYESIVAYGRYWIFDSAGTLLETQPLLNVSRYASGPCAYRPAGSTCKFDSRDQDVVPGGVTETITAYGRYFEWDASGNPTANHGQLLTAIPRML